MTSSRRQVLQFIDTIGPGGAETILLELARELKPRGWESRLALTGPGWVSESATAMGLPVDMVPTSGRLDIRYLKTLRRIVRDHGVDLIHAHLFSPGVYASLVGAATGVPVVVTFHGASDTEVNGWGRELRMRLVNRGANIVCVSESLRDGLVGSAGISRDDIRVIHNGVDLGAYANVDGGSVRAEHGVSEDAILVGALGNVRPAKDFPNLLEAAALLAPDKRLTFVIVGETTEPWYSDLLEIRARLGLDDRVSFWGFRSDVPQVMAAFDVLAISSSTEGFSLAAIQAMATGTPVVSTRSGGPERIITHGVDGLLVAPGTPAALAGGIKSIIDEPTLGSRLAARGRQTVRARFSSETMLDQYEALYTSRCLPRSTRGRRKAASSKVRIGVESLLP